MLQILSFFFHFHAVNRKNNTFLQVADKDAADRLMPSCGTIICCTDNRIVCFTQLFNDLWDLFYNFAPK